MTTKIVTVVSRRERLVETSPNVYTMHVDITAEVPGVGTVVATVKKLDARKPTRVRAAIKSAIKAATVKDKQETISVEV